MSELNVGDSVDISRVGIVYTEMKNSLQTSSEVSLNISNINHIDGAGMQLIYAYINAAKNKGLNVSISEPSASVRSVAKILGLESLMGWSA